MTNVVLLKRKTAPRRITKYGGEISDGLSLLQVFRKIKLKSDRRAVISFAKKLAKKK